MSAFDVNIRGTYLGQIINNVIGVRGPGDVPAGAQAQAIADRVLRVWAARVVPVLSTQYRCEGVDVVSITNPGIGAQAFGNFAGGNISDPVSGAICGAVDVLTGLRGRSFRGRTGLTGVVENAVSGNLLVEASRVDYETRVRGFRTDLGTGDTASPDAYEWGVVSRFAKLVKREPPIFTPSIAVNVRARVGTRVSRLR
jgi:hypothetical protein